MSQTPYDDSLPLALTSFFGRETVVVEIASAVRQKRCVTVTGMGGIGKTRTAIEVARLVVPDFRDGIVFVDLAALPEGTDVGAEIRRSLGASDRWATDSQVPTDVIGQQRMLIILDNCEHVIAEAEAAVTALLRACHNANVLATSREPLGIPGESLWRLEPLPLPRAEQEASLEVLRSLPAVDLFVDRARRVQPTFELTVETATATAEICRALDGIPLAIELAAARLRTLSVTQLAARLGEQLVLLSGGSRGAPERQRTMRAAIAWSHDQLGEPQRVLFRRLAVFSAGWTLEAAEGVCAGGPIPGPDMLDLLESLVDRSLVSANAEGPEARFRFLVPVREFARGELIASGEGQELGSLHCRWFADLAARAEPHLFGPSDAFWTDRLAADEGNFGAALSWAETHPADLRHGLQLSGDLRWFWSQHGRFQEGRAWTRRLRNAQGSAPPTARAAALVCAAWMAAQIGDLEAADEYAGDGVELAREFDDKWLLGTALWVKGQGAYFGGRLAEAQPMLREALSLAESNSDWRLATQSLCALAGVESALGHVSLGKEFLTRALRLAGDNRSQPLEALALNALGEVTRLGGDLAEAAEYYRRASESALAAGHPVFVAMGALNLGMTEVLRGAADVALPSLRVALELVLLTGDRAMVGTALTGVAALQALGGDAVRAAVWLSVIDRDMGDVVIQPPDQPVLDRAREAVSERLGVEYIPQVPNGMGLFEAARDALELTRPTHAPASDAAGSANGLSRRELEVLSLLTTGATNREIADRLVLSTRTVETHLANIYGKLGVRSRVDAVRSVLEAALAPGVVPHRRR